MTISKRAQNVSPSPTLSITAKAKEMKADGIDVVSFGAGEPDFDTPLFVKNAAIKAINEGFTKYTATSGIPELKKAVCEKLKRDNNLVYNPSNILVSNGAKQSLYNIMQVLVNPGDEVLMSVPYWGSYEEMVKLAGGTCVFIPAKNFKINASNIASKITSKTKLLILNSPSNPTGMVIRREELKKIADLCVRKNIFVISDEIYEKIIYGVKHASIAGLGEKIKNLTIVINGVSKSHAMTGWRIGYAAGPENILKAAGNVQDHTTSNPNSIAQKAALEALLNIKESDKFIAGMVLEYRKRRDYMVHTLNNINGVKAIKPEGAFYIFADVSGLYGKNISGSMDLCNQLLEKAHIALIPGIAFGDDNFVRLSFAASMENIKRGLERFKKFAANAS